MQESGHIADIKLIPAICPRCGANLNLPEDLQKAYCTYCGTEILIGKAVAAPKVECKMCEGFGRVDICRACDGGGRCTWSTRSSGARNGIFMIGYSSHCENGTCSACGGSGRYALSGCPGCAGTGQCPRCLGTGKCPACRGVGTIPSPNGSEICQTCGGTGVTDPGSPRPQELSSRCPKCSRALVEDSEYCPHCGYKRNACPSCGALWVIGSLSCDKCGFGKNPDREPEA